MGCGRVSPHVPYACAFHYVVRWCQDCNLGPWMGGAGVKHGVVGVQYCLYRPQYCSRIGFKHQAVSSGLAVAGSCNIPSFCT